MTYRKRSNKRYGKKSGFKHDEVTKKIIEAIESGSVGNFEMPWHRQSGRPINALTRKPYRGSNTLTLWVHGMNKCQEWATYRQWQAIGGQVGSRCKGKGAPICFYRPANKDSNEVKQKEDQRKILNWSTVFNREDVDGLPPLSDELETEMPEKIANVENYVSKLGGDVRIGGERAYYSPLEDYIAMPIPELFKAGEATSRCYSTLCHEYSHWTGHGSRLDRLGDLNVKFGDPAYAQEELAAEIGAAMLCADLGIDNMPRDDHAAYIQSWLQRLKNVPGAFSQACREANEIVTYLHGLADFKIDTPEPTVE